MIKKKTWDLGKIIYEFTQEGNTDGTTDEFEELSIEVQGCATSIEQGGGYHVIRTKTGWSYDDPQDFMDILVLISKGVPSDEPAELPEKDSDYLP